MFQIDLVDVPYLTWRLVKHIFLKQYHLNISIYNVAYSGVKAITWKVLNIHESFSGN